MARDVPIFRTDQEAEAFLDQDLSDLDFSQFRPMSLGAGETQLDLSLPRDLLEAIAVKAKAAGAPTARYIRDLLERDVAR